MAFILEYYSSTYTREWFYSSQGLFIVQMVTGHPGIGTSIGPEGVYWLSTCTFVRSQPDSS